MKKGLGARGYTLVEVMIVMAISGGLLVSAMLMISGQQQKTEFSQALRDVDSQIQDVLNDVATGYYANTGNFRCDGATGRPRLQTVVTGDSQGSNQDCVFIGRVIQFGVAGSDRESFNVINVVGLRQALAGGAYANSQTLAQARPTAMAPGTGDTASFPDSTDRQRLRYGLRIASMRVANQPVGAVGFFGSLSPGAGSTGGNLLSGAQTVNLVPVPGTNLDQSAAEAVNAINALDTAAVSINPANGVVLCFQSGGTNEYGLITIGTNARRLTTTTEIRQGSCP